MFRPSNTDTRTHLLVTASLAKELVCLPRRPEWCLLGPDWFGWKHMAIAELATLVTEVKCAISQSQGQSWLFFCSPLVHSASPERWELRAERRGCCSKIMMLCRKKWMLRQSSKCPIHVGKNWNQEGVDINTTSALISMKLANHLSGLQFYLFNTDLKIPIL